MTESFLEKKMIDFIIIKIKELFDIEEKDPIVIEITKAFETSMVAFSNKYGSCHGFIMKDSNWNIIKKNFFFLTEDVEINSLDLNGSGDESPATQEQATFFVATLQNEFKKIRDLERIIAEKKHQKESVTKTDLDDTKNQILRAIAKQEIFDIKIESFLNKAKELLDGRNFKEALEILNLIKTNVVWNSLTDLDKFRAVSNIAFAMVGLGNYQSASNYLIDSNKYESVDEHKRNLNMALAYFFRNDNENVKFFAEKVLEKEPLNFKAINLIINIIHDKESFKTFIDDLFEEIRNNSDVSLAIANKYFEFKDLDNALFWINKSIDVHKTPEKQEFKAEILLAKIENSVQVQLTGKLNNYQKTDVSEALKCIDEAWSQFKTDDEKKVNIRCLIYKAFCLDMTGDVSISQFYMNEAIKLCPENQNVLNSSAKLFYFQKEYKKSIAILQKLVETNPCEDNKVKYIESLISGDAEDWETAEIIINEILDNKNSTLAVAEKARYYQFHLLINREKYSEAEIYAEKLLETQENLRVYTMLIDAQIHQGKYKEAKDNLINSLNAQNNEPDSVRSLLYIKLANQFYNVALHLNNDIELFEKAAGLYEKIVSFDVHSIDLYKLASSYYLIGHKDKALKICSELRERTQEIYEDFTKTETTILFEAEKYKEAYELSELFIEKFPDCHIVKMNKLLLALKLEKFQEIDAFLDEIDISNVNDMNEEDVNNYLFFMRNQKRYQKYRDFLYELCRKNPDNIKYSNLYCCDPFMIGIKNRLCERKQDSISIDDNVVLKIEKRGNQTIIIEEFVRKNKASNEVLASSDFGKRLIDRRLGDIVELKMEGNKPIMAEIISFESKYVALSKILHERLIKSPEDTGNILIEFPENLDKFSLLKTLFEISGGAERLKQIEESKKHYQEKAIPFYLYSKSIGKDLIDNWLDVTKNKDLGFWSSVGNYQHLQKAIINIDKVNTKIVVIDIHSLLFLYKINDIELMDVLKKSFNKVLVHHSVLSYLGNRLDAGIFLLDESFFQSFKGWITENFEIVSDLEKIQKQTDDIEKLKEVFGECTYYSMIYAKNNECLFCCDDYVSREIIENHFKICSTTFLEAVFKHWFSDKKITLYKYVDIVIAISNMFYFPMILDHNFYAFAIAKNNFELSENIKNSFSYLGGHVYVLDYALNIVIPLTFTINDCPVSDLKKSLILDHVLDCLFYKREANERGEIIKIIKKEIMMYENSKLFQDKHLSRYFDSWQKRKLRIYK